MPAASSTASEGRVTPRPPSLSASAEAGAPSLDGTFRLEWTGGGPFRLDLAPPGRDFLVWYEGSARTAFVSGQPTGEVRVRVREGDGPWSEPVAVPVAHTSLTVALALAAVGASVFSTVAGYVIAMALRPPGDRR